jgi:glycerol-3-phosphate acyltransferase PlsX
MIAVDVMGGDNAPQVIVQGALRAARKVPVLLVGPEVLVRELVCSLDPAWEEARVAFCDAQQVIGMGEDPVAAVRAKGSSSLVKAVSCVKEGIAAAVLSAGSSGALMVAATFILGREYGIERPAIAGFFPSVKEQRSFVLDLGANTECRASHLEQFAHLGCSYVSMVSGIGRPTVGILANGTEDKKGSLLVKEAFAVLRKSSLQFVGNLEPGDVFGGHSDVVVCDGFPGNIFLKTLEASFSLFAHLAQRSGVLVREVSDKLGYRQRGGALLLGVKGTAVVCHGSADAHAIEQGILFAWKCCRLQ